MNNEYLSKEGLEKIKNELEHLKTKGREEVAARLKFAKSLGDLSENAEYKAALDAQSMTEERIAKLEDIIKRAVVIEKTNGSTVELGSLVVLKKEGDESKTFKYTIVGPEEADIVSGKISNKSPIGSALIGKKKGDKISVKTPSGGSKYTILELS